MCENQLLNLSRRFLLIILRNGFAYEKGEFLMRFVFIFFVLFFASTAVFAAERESLPKRLPGR
jgi:hypothetical protein